MINPRPESGILFDLAQENLDPTYLKQSSARYKTYKIALKQLDKVYPPEATTKYLDLSCYYGFFVDTLVKSGREALGVDICSQIIEKANEKFEGRRLYSARVEAWPAIFPKESFDVLTSWDAIEHVDDPIRYLMSSNQLLKRKGILALSTMNYDSRFAKMLGTRWPWLMPMHLFYFTPKSIVSILEKSGFEIISIDTYPHVITLGYLLYKLNRKYFEKFMYKYPLDNIYLKVDFRDFMTVYARKL